MKNARFWTWINGAWVKITLRPGQSLEWNTFEYTDEGWAASDEVWEYEDGVIVNHMASSGTDCDGRIDHYYSRFCHVDDLSAIGAQTRLWQNWINDEPVFHSDGECPPRPDWQEGESSQRDYYAESMNY